MGMSTAKSLSSLNLGTERNVKCYNGYFVNGYVFHTEEYRYGRKTYDTTKRLMSSPKCRSVEVINNPARPGSNHREVNCINYK
jgi:hypothetical protein